MTLIQTLLLKIADDGLYSIPVLSLNASKRPELGSDIYDFSVC